MNKQQLKQKILRDHPELLGAIQAHDNAELLKRLAESSVVMKGEKGDKGDQGEPGYTPVKGVDYFTRPEVNAFLEASTPVKGRDYFDGEDGKDGLDGRDGKNGKDGVGIPGRDGSPDTPEQIAEKVNTLEDIIEPSVIKGGVPTIDSLVKELRDKQLLDISHIRNGLWNKKGNNKGKIDNSDLRWHGGGLSKVVHDTTLTGDGTSSSPLHVVSSGGSSPVGGLNAIQVYGTSTTFNGDNTKASLDPTTGDMTVAQLNISGTDLYIKDFTLGTPAQLEVDNGNLIVNGNTVGGWLHDSFYGTNSITPQFDYKMTLGTWIDGVARVTFDGSNGNGQLFGELDIGTGGSQGYTGVAQAFIKPDGTALFVGGGFNINNDASFDAAGGNFSVTAEGGVRIAPSLMTSTLNQPLVIGPIAWSGGNYNGIYNYVAINQPLSGFGATNNMISNTLADTSSWGGSGFLVVKSTTGINNQMNMTGNDSYTTSFIGSEGNTAMNNSITRSSSNATMSGNVSLNNIALNNTVTTSLNYNGSGTYTVVNKGFYSSVNNNNSFVGGSGTMNITNYGADINVYSEQRVHQYNINYGMRVTIGGFADENYYFFAKDDGGGQGSNYFGGDNTKTFFGGNPNTPSGWYAGIYSSNPDLRIASNLNGGTGSVVVNGGFKVDQNGKAVNSLPQTLKGYTVAGLPAGTIGDIAYVTDATVVVAKGVAPIGGGTAKAVVWSDGIGWRGI